MTAAATVLEQLIDEKGFRKSYLARQAGMHPSQLSRLLHSERDPKLSVGAATIIAERLGVPVGLFFDGERLLFTNDIGAEQENAPSRRVGQQGRAKRVKAAPKAMRPETGPSAGSQRQKARGAA